MRPSQRSFTILAIGAVTALLAATTTAAASACPPPSHHHATYGWSSRPIGVDEQFRGLAAVSRTTAWVSGETGNVLRTTDGGRHWVNVSPPAAVAGKLALRDIEAWNSRDAVVLSIGNGTDSRIFRTSDGGRTWTQTFTNTDAAAFYDCMAFGPTGTGLAMSDPVDGYFRMARTTDWGRTWKVLPTSGMPAAGSNEFGFAASGTCIVSAEQSSNPNEFWFASGGTTPRIFHTVNAGRSWSVANTPVRGGDSAGIYSIAFKNSRTGIAVGGDYTAPTDGTDAAAWTRSGYADLKAARQSVTGYRSGVAFLPGWGDVAVAVGPTGSDVSTDGGMTWTNFSSTDYDGVHCAPDGTCWASGPHGAAAILTR